MRLVLVLALMACRPSASSPSSIAVREETGPSFIRPRPPMRAAIAGCRGDSRRSDVSIDVFEPDAPSVIVERYHLHGGGPPSPTIAVWSDGQVLFAGKSDGKAKLLTTNLSIDAAAELARDVFRVLEAVPLHTTVHDISGGMVLRITVRDGTRWRSASLYGDDHERVLAVARGTAAPPAAPRASNPYSPSALADSFAQRPWPPLGFAKAYERLVGVVPGTGAPSAPHDYDALFIMPERGIDPDRPALPWPADLPTPPEFSPTACRYNETDDLEPSGGCRFMLGRADNAAVERFTTALRRGNKSRAVNLHGNELAVQFDGLYRGERTIDALTACASVLSRSN